MDEFYEFNDIKYYGSASTLKCRTSPVSSLINPGDLIRESDLNMWEVLLAEANFLAKTPDPNWIRSKIFKWN